MANVKAWGLSKHGLCTNGLLALPNGDTVDFAQPASGDCSLIKFSDTPSLNLSNEDVAKLNMLGLELRDYALWSGDGVAGVDVPGDFIYKAPNGERWAVDTSSLVIAGNALSGSVVFRQFGKFEAVSGVEDLVSHTVEVSLADAGQSSPVILSADETETLSNLSLDFEGGAPTGDECLIRIDGIFSNAPQSSQGSAPIGFLALSISGNAPPVVAASIHKNRADTIGVTSSLTTDGRANVEWILDATTQDWTTTPPPPDDVSFSAIFSVGTFNLVESVVGRVIAVIYDSAGAKQDLVFEFSYTTETISLDPVHSGGLVSMAYSGSDTGYVKLTMAGNELRLDGVGTSSGDVGADYVVGDGVYYDSSHAITSDVDGDVYSDSGSTRYLISGSNGSFNASGAAVTLSTYTASNGIFSQDESEFYSSAATGSETQVTRLNRVHLTSHLHGFNKTKIDALSVYSYFKQGVLSPISFDAAVHPIASLSINPYATYQPYTDEIIWNSAEPVCFI